MKVAFVYDRINKWGGAERVLLALHELFPDAPLYTSVYDPEKTSWAHVFNIKTSFLQKLPFASSNHELLAMLMPIAFESFSFDEYDLVISLTSEAAKGIITKPKTRHICYCLTPTRYLWSGYDEYFQNKLFKAVSSPVIFYLKGWDKQAAYRPDLIIAISKEVQKRIKKYYGFNSEVIYPPLCINNKKPVIARKNDEAIPSSTRLPRSPDLIGTPHKDSNFFLVVSRLVSYKRIDLAILACNELHLSLKIIGTGKEEKKLKQISGKTIEFLGSVSDEQLIALYIQAKAVIHPGIEDFGLTIVEAQKYGSPVIAFRGGGALETIKERKSGLFFDQQKKESLIKAILEFDQCNFKQRDCVKQAELFSFNNFKTQFLSLVEKVV